MPMTRSLALLRHPLGVGPSHCIHRRSPSRDAQAHAHLLSRLRRLLGPHRRATAIVPQQPRDRTHLHAPGAKAPRAEAPRWYSESLVRRVCPHGHSAARGRRPRGYGNVKRVQHVPDRGVLLLTLSCVRGGSDVAVVLVLGSRQRAAQRETARVRESHTPISTGNRGV